MKNINMKKVVAGAAALGISAMFAGAVVAANVTDSTWTGPTNLTKAVLFTNGVPAYNIIIGSAAMPIDVVWGGNIAAAIGKKAYTTTTTGGTLGDVVVEVGGESTTSVSGDGKLTDDWTLGSAITETIDNDDYTLLGDYDVKVDDSLYSDDSENVKDTLAIKATIGFDSDKDVADLTATINKKDIDYTVEFTPALKKDANDSGSPDMKFNIMGKQYTVEDWEGITLKLVQNKATTPYDVGDTFEVDGYTVEVISILEKSSTGTDYEVEMSISKDGSVLATEVYADGETIFDEYLDIDTEVDTVYNSRVTIVSGTSARVSLKDGTVIKDFPNIDDELWYVDFTEDGSDGLLSLNIYNNDNDVEWKNEDALKVGDEIELPNGFAKVKFLGLTEESTKTVSVDGGILSYTDSSDDDHDLFVYEEETGTYAEGDTFSTSQEIDGKQLYITFVETAQETAVGTWDTYANGLTETNEAAQQDGYFTVQLEDEDGKFLTASTSDYATASWSWASGAATDKAKIVYNNDTFTSVKVPLYNNENVTIAYGIYVSESTSVDQIAIGLKAGAQGTVETGQTWTVGNTWYDIETNANNAATFVGATNAGATTVATEDMTSMFALAVTDGVDTVTAYIDADTGELVNTDDTSYSAAKDQAEVNTTLAYTLNQEDSEDLTWGYTEFGSKAEVDGGLFTMEIPEKRVYGQIFIGGGVSSETTLNGGEVTLTEPGTVVTTEDGAISVKLVSGGATGSEAMTPSTWNSSTNRLVYLDDEKAAGNMILVGGFVVNTLTVGTYGLEDKLVQSGAYVVGKAPNGNIVVAGTDAADTANAAKELIAAIENM